MGAKALLCGKAAAAERQRGASSHQAARKRTIAGRAESIVDPRSAEGAGRSERARDRGRLVAGAAPFALGGGDGSSCSEVVVIVIVIVIDIVIVVVDINAHRSHRSVTTQPTDPAVMVAVAVIVTVSPLWERH